MLEVHSTSLQRYLILEPNMQYFNIPGLPLTINAPVQGKLPHLSPKVLFMVLIISLLIARTVV